jgi:hypothetical protein
MMNFKALRNGFAFVEVVMALVVIGFMLTGLLVLQGNSFRRVVVNTLRIDRFYPVKSLLISTVKHPLEKGQTRVESRNEELDLALVYEQKEPAGASELARFKGLYQRKAMGTWFEQGRERLQEIISYGFTSPADTEKKS